MEKVLEKLKQLEEQNKAIMTALVTIVMLLDENRESNNNEVLKERNKRMNDIAMKITMDVLANELDKLDRMK